MAFNLDPQLTADAAFVVELPLCAVLLMNDRHYPWLVLVPRREGLRDIDELPRPDLPTFLDELRLACAILRSRYRPYKLNVAALGNQVPQLHVHVIGRFQTDPAWPRPVWGTVPADRFSTEDLASEITALQAVFAAERGALETSVGTDGAPVAPR